MEQPEEITPFGAIEHDLANTASERVSAAIYSVLQLVDDQQAKFCVAVCAMNTAIGITAGVFKALKNAPEADPFELAKTILDIARSTAEAQKEQGAASECEP